MKLAHEFGLPPLLLLNQNRDFDLEANSFYKPFKFIVLFMLNPNLNQEGADTLITTHFRQGQLPWQVEKAISIAPEGEMRDMLWMSLTLDAAPGEIGHTLIQKQFFEMLPADFTKQDAVKQAQVLGIAKSTMGEWLKKFTESAHIERVAHGKYRKSNFKIVS